MQTVIYAATKYGYSVQVVDGNGIDYEYTAGNHQLESQAVRPLVLAIPSSCRNCGGGPSRRQARLHTNGAFQRIGSNTMPT